MLSALACRPFHEESTYSILSRIHVQTGVKSPLITLKKLTGCRGYKPVSGLPTHLNMLATALSNPGGAVGLAQKHTHFQLYAHFLTEMRRKLLLEAMLNKGAPKSRLGILASRVRSDEVLRCCPACIKGDIEKYGVALWHRGHLTTGSIYCHQHELRLCQPEITGKNVARRLMLPPRDCKEIYFMQKEVAEERLVFLSQQMQLLLSKEPTTQIGSAVYKQLLKERNLASSRGRVKQEGLKELVRDWLTPLLGIPEFQKLYKSLSVERSWLAELVAGDTGFHHPLKHLVLWGAIESDISKIMCTTSRFGEQLVFEFDVLTKPEITKSKLQSALSKYKTLRGAAAHLGISITTAGVYADIYELEYKKRTKKLDDQLRNIVRLEYRKGTSKGMIALSHGISISSVNRIIRCDH